MNILAVTCYTGGQELCEMTHRMVNRLRETMNVSGVGFIIVATAQGAADPMWDSLRCFVEKVNANKGFAFGMNLAIARGVSEFEAVGQVPDYVLCINNDIEMPDRRWVEKLLLETDQNHITAPVTDVTSLHARRHAVDAPSFTVSDLAAYCWMVPFGWCRALKEKHGFWLFSTEFGFGYSEDNWTAILLQRMYGDDIFRVVPRSWVKHLKAQTAKVVKPDRRASSRLLKQKIAELSKEKDLSPALRKKLSWYRKVLRC